MPGHEDFIEAMADPSHEEHADKAAWIGRDSWDPSVFDTSEANPRLEYFKL